MFLRRQLRPVVPVLFDSPPQTRRRDAPIILLTIYQAELPSLAMPFEAWHSIQMLQGRDKKATNSPDTVSWHTERISAMPLFLVILYVVTHS